MRIAGVKGQAVINRGTIVDSWEPGRHPVLVWPGNRHSVPRTSQLVLSYYADAQLVFPFASRLRFHRRDVVDRRAGGGGAVRGSLADRAYSSIDTDAEAA